MAKKNDIDLSKRRLPRNWAAVKELARSAPRWAGGARYYIAKYSYFAKQKGTIMRAIVSLINLLAMVLFLSLIILGVSKIAHAYDQWSDGTPLLDWVNPICCGEADAHRVPPTYVEERCDSWHVTTKGRLQQSCIVAREEF